MEPTDELIEIKKAWDKLSWKPFSAEEMKKLTGKGTYRNLNRIGQRIAGEILLILSSTVLLLVLTDIFDGLNWIKILFGACTVLFIYINVLGYWYIETLPVKGTVRSVFKECSRRMNTLVALSWAMNISILLLIISLIFLNDQITNRMAMELGGIMFINIMAWVFSFKWIGRAKEVRRKLRQFREIEEGR